MQQRSALLFFSTFSRFLLFILFFHQITAASSFFLFFPSSSPSLPFLLSFPPLLDWFKNTAGFRVNVIWQNNLNQLFFELLTFDLQKLEPAAQRWRQLDVVKSSGKLKSKDYFVFQCWMIKHYILSFHRVFRRFYTFSRFFRMWHHEFRGVFVPEAWAAAERPSATETPETNTQMLKFHSDST